MKKNNQYIIDDSDTGLRLDVFLSEKLKISRSQVKKLIEKNLVKINDELPKKAGDILKIGYNIEITPEEINRLPGQKKSTNGKKIKSEKKLVPKIISKTKDYLVIEKPSGLLTHATPEDARWSIASWLQDKYPETKKVGDDPKVRPGIVHRLDKEASGLMVIARNQKMFECLKKQFKERTVEKEYFALAHGRFTRDWETLNFPIARSENAERMAARPVSEEIVEGEKEAITEFMVEKMFVNFTLLRVTLHTGRMHQIRVHMLAYNHPLVGDPLYFQKKRKRDWDEKLGRLFLHSTKLSFTDLVGSRKTFESELPDKLKMFLDTLA